jgi:hypothetical protein
VALTGKLKQRRAHRPLVVRGAWGTHLILEERLDSLRLFARVEPGEREFAPRLRARLRDDLDGDGDAGRALEVRPQDFVPGDDPPQGVSQRGGLQPSLQQDGAPGAQREPVLREVPESLLLR